MAGAIGRTQDTPHIVAIAHAESGTIALYVAPEGEIGGRLAVVLTREDALHLASILDGLTEGRW
jgi:hypothetical protein